jgi:hypothetical protein
MVALLARCASRRNRSALTLGVFLASLVFTSMPIAIPTAQAAEVVLRPNGEGDNPVGPSADNFDGIGTEASPEESFSLIPFPLLFGEHWDRVDDAGAHDGDTTFVQSTIGDSGDLYTLTDFGVPSATINDIELCAVMRRANVLQREGFFGLKTNGRENWGGANNAGSPPAALTSEGGAPNQVSWPGNGAGNNTDFATYCATYALNPATGAAWTPAEIDALQVGFFNRNILLGGFRATQIYVTVDYTEAPAVGSLTVNKYTFGGEGTFELTLGGDGAGTDNVTTINGTGAVVFDGLSAGTYSVTETEQEGWYQAFNNCTDIEVAAGQDETCTIINTKVGQLTVAKVTSGGTATFSFEASIDGEEPEEFDITTIAPDAPVTAPSFTVVYGMNESYDGSVAPQSSDVAPVPIELTELTLAGWNFVDVQCMGLDPTPASEEGESGTDLNFSMDTAGQEVQCTFSNAMEEEEEEGEMCVPEGVYGYWKLDDAVESSSAADSSGNARHGTYVNGPTQNSDTPLPVLFSDPFSRDFDGSDDYVDLGDIANFTTNFSVSAWVNPATMDADRQIVSRGYDGTNTQWELKTSTAGGKVFFRSWQGGHVGVESSATIPTETWTHLVGTFDGTTWRIYINGTLDNSAVAAAPLVTARHAVIGGVDTPTGFRQLWDGLIDDVRIYDRALTNEEIDALADGTCPDEEEEEEPVLLSITKYMCPATTVITREANGPAANGVHTAPESCDAQAGIPFGHIHQADKEDTSSPYPGLSDGAPFTLLGVTNGSGVLQLSELSTEGRHMLAELDGEGAKLSDENIVGFFCYGDAGQGNNNYEAVFLDEETTAHCIAYNAAPVGLDFGDAPYPFEETGGYPTLLDGNGARHVIVSGFHLGTAVDAEEDGQPNVAATGNDDAGVDDEDGVIFSGPLMRDETSSVTVTTALPEEEDDGYLEGWIDWNQDGDWMDGDEHVVSTEVGEGVFVIEFVVPAGATLGDTYARFRWSSVGGNEESGLLSDGAAPDGEVEDYRVTVIASGEGGDDGGDGGDDGGDGGDDGGTGGQSFAGTEDGESSHSSHRGNRMNSLTRIANFLSGLFSGTTPPGGFGGGLLPPGSFGGGPETPFSENEIEFLCSMKESIPPSATSSAVSWFANYLGTIMGRDGSQVLAALLDEKFCTPAQEAQAVAPKPIAVRVDGKGYIVSSNPVWNACVRGKATIGLIRKNRDTVMHRQGRIEVMLPLTCSDYHPNTENVWRHPDHAGLFVTLDAAGRLTSALPRGYVAVREQVLKVASN